MKDKTQKSFRGIVRILLLVFCYTFGSHAFALALEHEQTVEGTECTIRFYFLGRKSVRKGFNTLFMNLIRKK